VDQRASCAASFAPEGVARRRHSALTDEAAVLAVKPWKPEAPRQREPRMRRREPVRAVDPALRTQVFEDEPGGALPLASHRLGVTFG
jgi:hypothetical protein